MIRGTVATLILAVAVAVFAGPAAADGITYTWVGNNGFTGSFTLPSSAFAGDLGLSDFQVPDTAITAFTFTGDGVTFGLGDIGRGFSSGAAIDFNVLVSPPAVVDGAGGSLAENTAGYLVGLYGPADVTINLPSGGSESSAGEWVPSTATSTPEPGTLALLGAGLLGLSALRRKRLSLT